jgi:hypothetical protein
MESKSNNRWIVIVIALVIVFCCAAVLVLAAAAFFVGWPVPWPDNWTSLGSVEGPPESRTFEVDSSPELRVDNFAGSVTIRSGDGGELTVVATKHARRTSHLDQIEVRMTERGDAVVIETQKPRGLSNCWVKLEITAPAGTYLDVQTGSGSVDVSQVGNGAKIDTGSGRVTVRGLEGVVTLHTGSGGVEARNIRGSISADTGSGGIEIHDLVGDLKAHTGSGGIDVTNASGRAEMETGSGGIDYQGQPESLCHARTGSGTITLRLPSTLSGRVDLHTGSGSIDVEFDVDGHVTRQDVRGSVGSGDNLSIYAHTGSGSVNLVRR